MTGMAWRSRSAGAATRSQGKRANINSYMYGDAMAIAAIAEKAGKPDIATQYRKKAATEATLLDKLWDGEAKFFKVLPRAKGAALVDVRELHGYTPWYFGLPPRWRGL